MSMEILLETVAAIAAVVVISGAVDLLLSGTGAKSFARFACGLILMLILLTPLFRLLRLEPEALAEEAGAAMTRAEEMHADTSLLERQVRMTAQAAGAQVRVEGFSHRGGRIEGIELSLIEGDMQEAAQAICSAFGLDLGQVRFR